MKLSDTIDPDQRKERIEYVTTRWQQLHERSNERQKEAWSYLMTVNAGGAVAVLGFLGAIAAKAVTPIPNASWMLAAFVCGLVFVGFGRATAYARSVHLFERWRRDVYDYYNDRATWTEIMDRDERRSGLSVIGGILAASSFVCFLCGAALGLRTVIQ